MRVALAIADKGNGLPCDTELFRKNVVWFFGLQDDENIGRREFVVVSSRH